MYPAQAQAMAGRMLAFDRTDTLRLLNMTAAFDADAGMEGVCETVYGMQWALVTVFAGCLTLFGVACYVFYLRTKYDLMESLADLKRVASQRARDIPRSPELSSEITCPVGLSSSITLTSTATASRPPSSATTLASKRSWRRSSIRGEGRRRAAEPPCPLSLSLSLVSLRSSVFARLRGRRGTCVYGTGRGLPEDRE